MKYMTFNASCAFAGVANLLARQGVDVEDREIALGMELPYLFSKEGNDFLAGPMLQSSRWFDLYLRPLGFCLVETLVDKGKVPQQLSGREEAMLGLTVSSGGKHAVIYTGMKDGCFCFQNNKWQHTSEPEELCLTEEELLKRLEERVMVAWLEPAPVSIPDFQPLLCRSAAVLQELKEEILCFCSQEQSKEARMAALNPLFRPVLLDGITMLELIGQENLAGSLRMVQKTLLTAVREEGSLVLERKLDMQTLTAGMDGFLRLVEARKQELMKS